MTQDLLGPDRIAAFGIPVERRIGEPLEVRGRVEQPVRVIDPEAVHPSTLAPLEHEGMMRPEHFRVLHVKRYQLVDVEEPAVVDLARRAPPVHEPVRLLIEKAAEPGAPLVSGPELRGGLLERLPYLRR